MAYLHEDAELFEDLAVRTANALGTTVPFVVKDYYIYEMLKSVVNLNPLVVFKGGTSLSKCHHAIACFSEDVDLGMEVEHATEGQRKKMKSMVVESAAALGLEISNLDKTRSRREFNRYIMALPSIGGVGFESDTLVVETAAMTPASPAVRLGVDSLVFEYCMANGHDDMVKEFGLEEFELNVNSLERTYVDKVYALCDYYLSGEIPSRQSRHVYDLYKLQSLIEFDDALANLFVRVGSQRRGLHRCLSADPGVRLSDTVEKVDASNAYMPDYRNLTEGLLYEDIPYEVARSAFPGVVAFLRAKGL